MTGSAQTDLPTAIIVVDLGYGDAGKGTMTEWFAREYDADLVVRFNGGAQAGHNVVRPDGRHHTFSQFGAATFDGVPTLLSRFVAVHPGAMLAEADHLVTLGVMNSLHGMHIDERCIVTTPYHQAANRLMELARGIDRHGSCGVGHGITVDLSLRGHALRIGDVDDESRFRAACDDIRRALLRRLEPIVRGRQQLLSSDEWCILNGHEAPDCLWLELNRLKDNCTFLGKQELRLFLLSIRNIILEGAQGVLIDEWAGFHPNITWSQTTFDRAEQFLTEQELAHTRTRVGVLRAHTVRHGHGPMPSQCAEFEGLGFDQHNGLDKWQGDIRHGWFDVPLTCYAIAQCGGVDALVLTHMDAPTDQPWRAVVAYRNNGGSLLRKVTRADRESLGADTFCATSVAHQTAQHRLGDALLAATRHTVAVPHPTANGGNDFARWVSNRLGVEVRWTSFGPTYQEKRLVAREQRENFRASTRIGSPPEDVGAAARVLQ